MDDGTPELRFWNPDSLQETGRVTVTANGVPLEYINELEWVKGEVYANVWHTDRIARIDPVSGQVRGWIDLTGLLPKSDFRTGAEGAEQVLNGIAYDAAHDRLFVTGKYWPKLFEIKIYPKPCTRFRYSSFAGPREVTLQDGARASSSAMQWKEPPPGTPKRKSVASARVPWPLLSVNGTRDQAGKRAK